MRTEVIKLEEKASLPEALKKAAGVIKKGGLVAFPTETVYGLGADYKNKKAVERLYKVKDRPKDKPFTAHIANLDELEALGCEIDDSLRKIIEAFWPGPLTLIFKTSRGEKVGVRMPANKFARDFISICGVSLAAPSANISGRRPPRRAEDVLRDLDGKIEMLLDGGPAEIGIESTVMDVSVRPYRILRPGAVDGARIAGVVGRVV